MEHEQFSSAVETLAEAVVLLDTALATRSAEDWIITLETVKVVK